MFDLKRPEFTGEHRCIPCTIVNAAIALVGAMVLAGLLVWMVSLVAGLTVGIAFLAVACLLIWFRGYLVPGTPTMTRRYLPARVLRVFDKHPAPRIDLEEAEFDNSLELTLAESGIIEPCENEDDLCITADFSDELRDVLETTSHDIEYLFRVLSVDPDDVEFKDYGDAKVHYKNGRRVATWPSEAALTADIAIATLLPDWIGGWEDLPNIDRARLITGTRIFLEECPDDAGAVELRSDTVKSCCSEHEVIAAVCAESGDRLFEHTLA